MKRKLSTMLLLFVIVTNVGLNADAFEHQVFRTFTSNNMTTFVVKDDGSLWGWGCNYYYILNKDMNPDAYLCWHNPNSADIHIYTPIKIMDQVKSVSLNSHEMVFVLKEDGSLWSGGFPPEYTGRGEIIPKDAPHLAPVMQNVKEIITNKERQSLPLVVKNDNSLWMNCGFATDYYGRSDNERAKFIKIMDDIAMADVYSNDSMVAVTNDGTLWGWGEYIYNASNEEDVLVHPYFDVAKKIAEDVIYACAGSSYYDQYLYIKKDGSLWRDGFNSGIDVKILDDVRYATFSKKGDKPEFVTGFAIKNDNTLWELKSKWDLWDILKSTKNDKNFDYKDVFSSYITDNVKAVNIGEYGAAIIKTNDSLWMWGQGLGKGTDLEEPPIHIMDDVAAVYLKYDEMAILKNDGSYWMSGLYNYLGIGKVPWYINGGMNFDDQKKEPVKILDGVRVSPETINKPVIPKPIKLYFNEKEVELTLKVRNINGRTMYPFRECMEALGATVSFNETSYSAIGKLSNKTVEFPIDKDYYYANGKKIAMDTKTFVDPFSSRTYTPLRYAAEGLGFKVDWQAGEMFDTIVIKR